MQWINVKERLPTALGFYTVVTKPTRGRWSQRYSAYMYFSNGMFHEQFHQSKPIYWLEEGELPGPTKKRV